VGVFFSSGRFSIGGKLLPAPTLLSTETRSISCVDRFPPSAFFFFSMIFPPLSPQLKFFCPSSSAFSFFTKVFVFLLLSALGGRTLSFLPPSRPFFDGSLLYFDLWSVRHRHPPPFSCFPCLDFPSPSDLSSHGELVHGPPFQFPRLDLVPLALLTPSPHRQLPPFLNDQRELRPGSDRALFFPISIFTPSLSRPHQPFGTPSLGLRELVFSS